MFVKVRQNRNKPTDRLAFIDYLDNTGAQKSMPAYFDRSVDQSALVVGSVIEVMVSNIIWHKETEHNRFFDYHNPKCCFIKPPIAGQHRRAGFKGFSTEGSMCQTMSEIVFMDGFTIPHSTGPRNWSLATPGLMQMAIRTQDNVSGETPEPLTSGIGWFEKNPQNGRWRLAGLADLKTLVFATETIQPKEMING
jgi:hypothetical protein